METIESIVELQNRLEAMRSEEATKLQAEIEEIRDRLDSVEKRLRLLLGNPPKPDRKPLKVLIEDILRNSNETMTAAEIAGVVIDSGYQSNSRNVEKNFPMIVKQCLTSNKDMFRRANRYKPYRYALVK